MKNNKLTTRKDKVNYILDHGSDKTFTKYSILDLSYKTTIELEFIINKIK